MQSFPPVIKQLCLHTRSTHSYHLWHMPPGKVDAYTSANNEGRKGNTGNPPAQLSSRSEQTMPNYYQITVQGHLDARWSTWFDGLTITNVADGTAVLAGPVRDQAALHGVLMKVRDLGLPLIAVQ